jgi:uncharacterized protein (DUF488 family)
MKTVPTLLTVGHSNHEVDAFLDLLAHAGVSALADVRSSPYSKRYPQYNREELRHALDLRRIAYVFLGDELGGRPRTLDLYDAEGHVDYERVRQTDLFQQGVERVLAGLQEHTVALMCAEEDPLDCHRGLMITPAFVERGIAPGHLRRDGRIESTRAMEDRLLEKTRLHAELEPTLFDVPGEEERRSLLARAYRRMGRKKGYRLEE